MEPVKTSACNDVLHAAPGTEGDVQDLHIRRGHIPNSAGILIPIVISYWQPSEEDIANLLAGVPIALMTHGSTHPPLWVCVDPRI
jgi:hypothetical protein